SRRQRADYSQPRRRQHQRSFGGIHDYRWHGERGEEIYGGSGRLDFAPGQQSKTFFVLIIDNAVAEGNQTLSLLLRNPNGGGLVGRGLALLTIIDNDTLNGANQVDNSQFFVRRHYLDFLNRAPDASGL